MISYWFSRWQQRRRSTTSGFVFDDATLFWRSTSIRGPNFIDIHVLIHGWDITTSSLKKQPFVILEFYFRFRFRPYHRSRHAILHQSASKSDCPRQKNDVMSIFKVTDLRHLGFRGTIMGSLKSPCMTSYWSSRHHTFKLLSFWENCVFMFAFWRQTDKHTNRWTVPTH